MHGERRRWVHAEWGGIWGGMSPSSRLRGLGERHELPQRCPGQRPGRKRVLAYFEGHRTLIFVPIWQNLGGGAICISVPLSKFWGLVPLSSPWSMPMDSRHISGHGIHGWPEVTYLTTLWICQRWHSCDYEFTRSTLHQLIFILLQWWAWPTNYKTTQHKIFLLLINIL